MGRNGRGIRFRGKKFNGSVFGNMLSGNGGIKMCLIALCDDETGELDKTEAMLNVYRNRNPKYEMVIERFQNAEELLFAVREKNFLPDLLLLDIYMPKKLGTEVAKEFRELGNDGRILFLTSSTAHALEAFRVDAVQYLVKPVSENELFPVLDKIFLHMEEEQKKFLLLRIDGKNSRVALNDIVYCEAQGRYQCMHLSDGRQPVLRMTMTEIYGMLSVHPEFVKVGISYIVNLEHVDSLNAQDMCFDTGKNIHLPRGAYQPLREMYFKYYCEEM